MLEFIIIIVLAVVVLLVLAARKPDTFRIQRSTVINVTSDRVSPLINDFHQWQRWSPWAKIDPDMKMSYSGAASGVGSVYEWEGNSKVGTGRMEILAIQPAQTTIKLDFLKPFEGHNTAEFLIDPQGIAATHVTWAMYGPSNFVSKLMSVFGVMEKMVGRDFEKGLANMKAIAEKDFTATE